MRWPLARLTFAIWWKLLALLFLFGFLRGVLSYVLPWGQMAFWLAALFARVPMLSELMWKVLSAPAPVSAAIASVPFGLMLYGVMYGLLRLHIGRCYGGATLAWRTSPIADTNVFD